MRHASLVSQEGGEVAWLGRVVLGKGLDLAAMAAGSLAGKEPQGAVAGSRELPVRLEWGKERV